MTDPDQPLRLLSNCRLWSTTSSRLTNGDAAAAVDDLLRALADALVAGQRIELRGFGTFEIVLRAPRTGRNPHRRVEVKIPSRWVPVFRPGTRLKRLGGPKRTRRPRIVSKEEVVRAARMYHTNADAAAALGIPSGSFGKLCQRPGVETPSARMRRQRE